LPGRPKENYKKIGQDSLSPTQHLIPDITEHKAGLVFSQWCCYAITDKWLPMF
jgi:hypothetical protein